MNESSPATIVLGGTVVLVLVIWTAGQALGTWMGIPTEDAVSAGAVTLLIAGAAVVAGRYMVGAIVATAGASAVWWLTVWRGIVLPAKLDTDILAMVQAPFWTQAWFTWGVFAGLVAALAAAITRAVRA